MQLNNQPIEKAVHSDLLDVHSVFYTIQGEGPHTGRPAVFVRLAGCNLQCPMCDTNYTTERWSSSVNSLFEIVQEQKASNKLNRTLVVITGGEPFRQDIAPFVMHLIRNDYDVQIETNGTLPLPDALFGWEESALMIVVSPKAGKVHPSISGAANAWKYVMRAVDVNQADGLPTKALDHSNSKGLARHPTQFPLQRVYIQPCDEQDTSKNKANLEACVASSLQNGYTLQTQLHKTIGVD